MASSQPREVEKTRTVLEKYTETDGVVLELTHEEAKFLAFVVGFKIRGISLKREETATRIYDALGEQGYSWLGKHYSDVLSFGIRYFDQSMLKMRNP